MADIPETDLAVLGAGPGGYAAAFLAADKGRRVTLIDPGEKPGGTCLHVGCIPSKALLHTAKLLTDARDAARFGIQFGEPRVDLDVVRAHANKVVTGMANSLAQLAKRRNVEYLRSRAALVDPQTLQLEDGTRRRFRHCILATGSSPVRPAALALASPRVVDSTGALRLDEVPRSLLVVGGGYIGLELGYVYAALGSRVTVVEWTDGLLPGVDRELVRPLQARLETLFDKIHLATKVEALEDVGDGVQATFRGEDGGEARRVFDRVLVAVGRRPNSAGLGLEHTAAVVDERGFIAVDAQQRTAEPSLYAVGDVAGEPMLAHKASHEGKIAVESILGESAAYDFRAVPAVVFTDPEIAWCGLTEGEAKKRGADVKVARFPWGASGRAMTLGRTEGLTKLIVDAATDAVLGVGIVGHGAGELLGEAVLAVEMGATARDLTLTMHPHPTLTETLGEGAEMLFGTATHLYRPKGR